MSASADAVLPMEVVARHVDSAPVDLDAMAAELGLTVIRSKSLGGDVSGSIRRSRTGFIVRVNADHPVTRQRFTLAHEIGHFVLHRDLIGDGITDDALYRSTLGGDIETQANRFAADILMPARLVRQVWREGERSLVGLTERFGVSEDAMRIRLRSLGLAA